MFGVINNDELLENPFAISSAVSNPERFYGRHHLALKIIRNLIDGNQRSLAYWGISRSGKTSLLRYLFALRNNTTMLGKEEKNITEFLFVPVELGRLLTRNPLSFYLLVLDRLTEICEIELPNYGEIRQIYSTYRTRDEYDLDRGIGKCLEKLAEHNLNVVLLFDDFNIVIESFDVREAEHISQHLKALSDEYANLRYLFFTNIDFPSLYKLAGLRQTDSSIHRSTESFPIEFLNTSEAIEFVTGFLGNQSDTSLHVEFSSEELDFLFRHVGTHPDLLRIACLYLYEAKVKWSTNLMDVVITHLSQDSNVIGLFESITHLISRLEQINTDSNLSQYLVQVANGGQLNAKILETLKGYGIVHLTHGKQELFSELFRKFVLGTLSQKPKFITFGSFGDRMYVKGKEIKITPTEYKLMFYLVQHIGEICPNASIEQAIWGDTPPQDPSSLGQLVTRVRKKIEANYQDPKLLLNMRGEGYYLTSDNISE